MADRKDNGKHSQKRMPQQESAFKKQNRGQNGKHQRLCYAVFLPENKPAQTIQCHQHGTENQIQRFLHRRSKPRAKIRGAKDHAGKAAETADLFKRFDEFVLIQVFKAVRVCGGKENVGHHNQSHPQQAVKITPAHGRKTPPTRDRAPGPAPR